MEEKKEIVKKIEDIKESINDLWNDINIKEVEKITESWNDKASLEYIKKINETEDVVNRIKSNLDLLIKYWNNYNLKTEKE